MKFFGKTLSQLAFSKADQLAFLEQWQTCDEFGLTTRQFCQSLVANGTESSKQIGAAGLQTQRLTDVLHGWLPELVIAGIEVATEAGDRQTGLKSAISQLQGGQNIVGKIASVLVFPFAIAIGVGAMGVYVSGQILSAGGDKLVNTMAMDIHNIVATWGVWVAAFFVSVLALLSVLLPTLHGGLRFQLDNLPIFSVYRLSMATSLLDTLANLQSCGLKLGEALKAVEQSSEPYLRSHARQMLKQSISQENLGEIVDTGLLQPFELSAIKVLGSHGQRSELLYKSARAHEKLMKKRLDIMSAVLPKIGLILAILLMLTLVGSATEALLSQVM